MNRQLQWRQGFTLVELIVSMGVLAVLLTMVSTVYNLAITSTGEATAVVNMAQSLRLLEEKLRSDLQAVPRTGSMLVIAPFTPQAFWDPSHAELYADDGDGDIANNYPGPLDEEREVYDPNLARFVRELPRADRLMFFAHRRTESQVHDGVVGNVAQIVYGHAELADLRPDGTWDIGAPPLDLELHDPDAGVPFPIAARQWHLARRVVVVTDAGDVGACDLDDADGPSCADPDYGPYWIVDGQQDIVLLTDAYRSEVDRIMAGTVALPAGWYGRSQLDVNPPATVASRLGHYMLPRCASFKVEWAIDPYVYPVLRELSEVVWFDPTTFDIGAGRIPVLDDLDEGVIARYPEFSFELNQLKDDLLCEFEQDPNAGRNLNGTDPQGGVAFFSGDPGNSACARSPDSSRPDPLFPIALRVTVDLYDSSNRFTVPTRHVMVIPVGT